MKEFTTFFVIPHSLFNMYMLLTNCSETLKNDCISVHAISNFHNVIYII